MVNEAEAPPSRSAHVMEEAELHQGTDRSQSCGTELLGEQLEELSWTASGGKTLQQDRERMSLEGQEGTGQVKSSGRAFWAEGRVSAKALGLERRRRMVGNKA